MSQPLLHEYLNLVLEKIRSKKKVKTKFGKPNFDFEEFKSLPSEAIMRAYAMNYLEPLGQGSARIAFVLSGNRQKVLKIALNEKGLAQNKAELEVYTDPATADMAAKIYDTDENNRWIVADIVRPLTNPMEFKKLTGTDWDQFVQDMMSSVSSAARRRNMTLRNDAPEFTKKVYKMAEKGSNKLKQGDLTVLDHWGKTVGGRVVILDYGFTEEVGEKYYDKKPQKAVVHNDTPTGR